MQLYFPTWPSFKGFSFLDINDVCRLNVTVAVQYNVHFIQSPIFTRVGRKGFAARSEGVDQYGQTRFGHIRLLLRQT